MENLIGSAQDAVAAVVSICDWKLLEPEFELGPGIKVGKLRGSVLGGFIRNQPESELELKHQDTEIFILQESDPERTSAYDRDDPFARLDRVLNVFTIILGEPIFFFDLYSSKDFFKTTLYHGEIYLNSHSTEHLWANESRPIDTKTRQKLKQAWRAADALWEETKWGGRIVNALTFYYLSWRAHLIEHTCIDLAIVLEVLFAPHSQSEISH